MYNTPVGSAIDHIYTVPENKKVRVLSDITITSSYSNITSMAHHNAPPTTSLRSVRRSWTNKSFVVDHTKLMNENHENEFLQFIGKSKNPDDC